jgi:uncharacterized protein (TIGR00661 family)
MRVLYGVVGEGMGHAIRSKVIVEHLLREGHEVEIMASSRAADFMAKHFAQVHRIHGLHIIYEDNRVRRGRTIFSNVLAGSAALPKQIRAYFELIEDFRPEAVISDFESWAYLYAKTHRLPIVSIDNMQVLNRCKHDEEILEGIRTSFELTRVFVKSKLPFCDHYLITSYFRPPLRKPDTTLVPPILRREILDAEPTRGDHLLVYQTAEGHDALVPALQACGLPCQVYGMRRQLGEPVVEGNLTYQPFTETGFVEHLASARAVLAGGGFTLLGEAVFLGKPVLSVPVGGQVEQILNARYLEREGFGRYAPEADADAIAGFLCALPRHEDALARYHQDGNTETFQALDGLLDRAAGGVL